MGPAFLRKYGVASASGTHIRVPMPVFDDPNLFAGNGDWTPADGDVKVSIDGGAEANIGTLPTFVNGAWQYVFTAMEWTGKTITVRIHDAAGDEVADQFFVIETFGHANAMYAVDFSTRDVTLADDAITASKFDESTAFPLKANDAGPTQVARTGADGDTLETLSDQLDAIAGSSGSGANVVRVTVKDGDQNLLENATVRMAEGVNSFTATTDANGIATFALDDATYSLAITKAGYSFTPASRVVDGAEAFEEEMTQVAITPAADPTQTNAYLRTYDGHGTPQASVTIEFQLLHASGEPGRSFPGKVFSATSNEQGNLTVNLLRGSRYQARRNHETGTGTWVPFTTSGSSTYQLPEVLGAAN